MRGTRERLLTDALVELSSRRTCSAPPRLPTSPWLAIGAGVGVGVGVRPGVGVGVDGRIDGRVADLLQYGDL